MHHSENTAFSWDDNLTVVYCKDQFWQDCLSQTHQPNCPAGMDDDALSGSDICKGQTEHWNDLTSRKTWVVVMELFLLVPTETEIKRTMKWRLMADGKSAMNAGTHTYVVWFLRTGSSCWGGGWGIWVLVMRERSEWLHLDPLSDLEGSWAEEKVGWFHQRRPLEITE